MAIVSTTAPSIDLNHLHRDIKLTSGEHVQARVWSALSLSNSQMNFSMPPPSMTTFMSRYMLRRVLVEVVLTGTNLNLEYRFAPRAFPIASITVSEQLSLNSQSFSLQTSDVMPLFERYMNSEDIQLSPSFLDKYANYSDAFGKVNSPLAPYNDTTGKIPPRGAFPFVYVGTPTAVAQTRRYLFTEPVFIPPLVTDEFNDNLGFSNLRSCELVTNFQPDLTRMFSADLVTTPAMTITGMNVTLSAAEILTFYTTPPPSYVPRPLAYNNLEIARFINPCPTITEGKEADVTSLNMQVNAVPQFVLLAVRPPASLRTRDNPDFFLNIMNVNINFNNVSGILSTSNTQSIYSLSRENGLVDDFSAFHGTIPSTVNYSNIPTSGSVVKLMFGKDISTPSTFVGQIGSFNLQLTARVRNQLSTAVTGAELVVIIGYPSKVVLHESGQVEKILGVSGQEGEYVSYENLKRYYGGAFTDIISKIGSFLQPINKFLKDTKLISTVASSIPHPMAQIIGAKAKEYGYGGMAVDGGAVISRAELKNRLAALT